MLRALDDADSDYLIDLQGLLDDFDDNLSY